MTVGTVDGNSIIYLGLIEEKDMRMEMTVSKVSSD